MKLLVTGATGFLGSYLCQALRRDGHQVVATGRNATAAPTGCSFIRSDLQSLEPKLSAADSFDAVIHCAALSSTWGAYRNFHLSNVVGTAKVIDICREFGSNRLIHISSPSIHARLSDQFNLTEAAPTPCRFLNHYGRSKHEAECLIAEATDLKSVIFRPQAITGPGERSFTPRLVEAAKTTGIPVFSNRNPQLDITDIRNVAGAIKCALAKPDATGTFNLSNGKPVPLHNLLKDLFERIDVPWKTKSIPYRIGYSLAQLANFLPPSWLRKEPSLTPYTLSILAHSRTLNIDKARQELDYQPVFNNAETINSVASAWKR